MLEGLCGSMLSAAKQQQGSIGWFEAGQSREWQLQLVWISPFSLLSSSVPLSFASPFLGCFHRLRNQLSVSPYMLFFWSLSHIYIYIFPPHHRHTDTQRHTDTLISSLTLLHTLSPLYTIKDTHSHFSLYTSCTCSFTHTHSFTQFPSLKRTPLHTVSHTLSVTLPSGLPCSHKHTYSLIKSYLLSSSPPHRQTFPHNSQSHTCMHSLVYSFTDSFPHPLVPL